MYFSGQGKLKVAPIVGGIIAAGYRWVGNVPDFKPAFAASKNDHKESYTGQRLTDKTLTTELNSTFSAIWKIGPPTIWPWPHVAKCRRLPRARLLTKSALLRWL